MYDAASTSQENGHMKQLLSSPSPSPSPASSPSSSLHTPSTSPLTSPRSRSSSPFVVFRRKDNLYTWDATPRLPRITTPATPIAAAPRAAATVLWDTDMMGKTYVAAPEPTAFPAAPQAAASLEAERPTTPTSPVEIHIRSSRHKTVHAQHHRSRRHFRQAFESDARRASSASHSPESIPPSVAALLAATSIPSPRSTRSLRSPHQIRHNSGLKPDDKSMRLDAIVGRAQEAEQEFSLPPSKGPLDVLLTLPADLEDDDEEVSVSDSTLQSSVLSTRTVSVESIPSLADSFASGTMSSVESPCTPRRDRCKAHPQRRSLTPVSSPPGERLEHPLSADTDDVDALDVRVFESSPDGLAKAAAQQPQQPPVKSAFKSAFKSNLTASLRALRNATRSFSGFNLTSIPPENFLARPLLTIDPGIPYTDERRPPPLEEEPGAALRRYLDPTTGARIDPRQQQQQQQQILPAMASASLTPLSPAVSAPIMSAAATALPSRSVFTASIQMQTYKLRRTKTPSPPTSHGRTPPSPPATPRRSNSSSSAGSGGATLMDDWPGNGPRQRELRENSDFIRIAVMEMSMRRTGKLDDRKLGRARLALPPRRMSTRPYIVGGDGVPARWMSVGPDGQ